jgi:hypothetical protein
MSTITSGTVLGAGLLYDSDTTGNLVIKTGPSAATTATFHGNTATTFNGEVYLTNISTPLRPLVSGTANASISGGTVVDFPTIPSWAKRVTVVFSGISTNGTANLQLQIGAGSIITSGYDSRISNIDGTNTTSFATGTSGFLLKVNLLSARTYVGIATLTLLTGNTWVVNASVSDTIGLLTTQNGSLALGGTLDRVRITANGTDTFDAGTINIMWEG